MVGAVVVCPFVVEYNHIERMGTVESLAAVHIGVLGLDSRALYAPFPEVGLA